MANTFFRFRQFTVNQQHSSMKVTTDACLFGAWTADLLRNKQGSLLDIGTGTGLLSLMIAQQFAGAINAIEVDESAAREAAANFAESPWHHRLQVTNVAFQQYSPDKKFDVVVSNPPFFSNDLSSPDERRNIALHSRQLSLAELFSYTMPMLADNGMVTLLVATRRNAEVEKLALQHHLSLIRRTWVHQTAAHDSFRTMYCFQVRMQQTTVIDESIFIRDEHGNYSSRFVELLHDYYLNLKKPPA
jgi:tRNA1Val (adenine37-N6)-methyltransferase